MFDLFGTEMPLPVKFFIAFAVVLALIGLAAWLVRRFGSSRLGGGAARGRQPRLAVIDAATVDGRRRLVLIRRDNVEHLLMIGGPTDVVVEPNIVRAAASRDAGPGRGEPSGRQTPVVENAWPLQPTSEPAPVAPGRTYRSPATEEPWHAPEPGARPRPADSMAGLAADLSARLNPPEVAAPAPRLDTLRSEPPQPRTSLAAALPPEPQAPPQTDHNLAEMAQQLEAALRRTSTPEGRPSVTDPLATPARPAARPPARDIKLRIDPRIEPKVEPRAEVEPKMDAPTRSEPPFDVRPEPKFESRAEQTPDAAPAVKPEPKPASVNPNYDNLEEEMANLLGRPPGKT